MQLLVCWHLLFSETLWSRNVCWCQAEGLSCGDQRRRTGSASALEALQNSMNYRPVSHLNSDTANLNAWPGPYH